MCWKRWAFNDEFPTLSWVWSLLPVFEPSSKYFGAGLIPKYTGVFLLNVAKFAVLSSEGRLFQSLDVFGTKELWNNVVLVSGWDIVCEFLRGRPV